jgi:hypothetical protein
MFKAPEKTSRGTVEPRRDRRKPVRTGHDIMPLSSRTAIVLVTTRQTSTADAVPPSHRPYLSGYTSDVLEWLNEGGNRLR